MSFLYSYKMKKVLDSLHNMILQSPRPEEIILESVIFAEYKYFD